MPSLPASTGVHETADADGHQSACVWSEANSATMPRLKGRLQGDVLAPKKGLRSHLRATNFQKNFLGEHAPDPTSLILRIQVQVWTNAILLPPGLGFCEYAR